MWKQKNPLFGFVVISALFVTIIVCCLPKQQFEIQIQMIKKKNCKNYPQVFRHTYTAHCCCKSLYVKSIAEYLRIAHKRAKLWVIVGFSAFLSLSLTGNRVQTTQFLQYSYTTYKSGIAVIHDAEGYSSNQRCCGNDQCPQSANIQNTSQQEQQHLY